MKLKNKLILIFILFACLVVFNNSDCFAAVNLSYLDVENNVHFEQVKQLVISQLDSYYNSYFLYCYENPSAHTKYQFDVILYNNNDCFICRSTNASYTTSYLVFDCSQTKTSFFGTYKFLIYCYENGNELSPTVSNSYTNSSKQQTICSYNSGYYFTSDNTSQYDYAKTNYFYSNTSIFSASGVRYGYTSNISSLSIIYEPEPETTKQDLFQLNLTDKKFNDALHTFTLNIDENFVNYSEITDLIENNNKYCIYVTDYTRLLTFSDNSFNATLEGGSYLLSGYIDFLVSDNAYFYFSPHYNRIKVCSGDYRGQDMSTYTKRYFFNLVYSDDSDDTYFTILDDNGLLWSLSDYTNDGISSQSDSITDIQNSYFIGSNQTIYYAIEDSNYFLDSLSDSIYYGKDRGADERIYNFGFSGGNTKEFYLNEATFNNKVSSENSSIAEKSPVVSSEETFKPVVILDDSNGNSSVIPQDLTTYTYPANTVTDETTSEEDATHRQNERTSYTSTDSNDDTSNWSLWDFVKGIFGKIGNLISSIGNLVTDLISGLVSLFVPSGDFFSDTFTDLGDWFELKLGFIFYPFQFFLDVFDRITNIEFGEPIISIPDITEPFSDEIIIHSVEFNFNDLLENEGIETAHNYYLMFVDVILIIGFINLLKNKFEEVTRR